MSRWCELTGDLRSEPSRRRWRVPRGDVSRRVERHRAEPAGRRRDAREWDSRRARREPCDGL